MPPKRSLRRPPAPPRGHAADTYTVGNRIYETASRRLVAGWRDGAHRFTELGRRLFRGRTVFVLEIPTLQVSTDRQWVDTQKEMYYPVTEETLPGVEERWSTLTSEPGTGAYRQITPAFKRWVIDRLRLETWDEDGRGTSAAGGHRVWLRRLVHDL